MKKETKVQAIELRRRGSSVKTIAKTLKVSVSTVSLWVRDVPLDSEMRMFLDRKGRHCAIDTRASKRDRRIEDAYEQAEKEWPQFRQNPDFMFGLALYLGEGYKTTGSIGVTNSDPAILRACLRFFSNIGCDMSRVRGGVILHQGESTVDAIQYWARELSMPVGHFHQVTPSKISGGKRARHLVHGTAYVKVGQTFIKWKLNRWMDLARQAQ